MEVVISKEALRIQHDYVSDRALTILGRMGRGPGG